MEVVVISIIVMASAIFVLWPLLRRGVGPRVVPAHAYNRGRENLLREKEAAIGELKEMEFDHLSGKLSLEDYSRLSSSYEKKVVKLLKELDDYEDEDPLSQVVEELIDKRRKDAKPGKVCPWCQCPLPVGGNYCPSCGTRINQEGMDGGK